MKKYDGEAGSFSPWWSLKGYRCPKPKTVPQNFNEICSFFSDYPDNKIDIVTPIFKKSEDNTDYSKQYLTTEVLEDGTISFNINSTMGTEYITSISYSTDNGNTWTTVNNVDDKVEDLVIPVSVNQGDKVLWKGNAQQTGYDGGASFFSSDCEFNVYGNVMSLLYEDEFIGQIDLTGKNSAFMMLFTECSNLISVENLILPTTTLTQSCYSNMFYGCTSLTTAPELPATTLASNCYSSMFSNCTSLNYIKCLATDISASDCTLSWVSGVAATGTFVKADSMTSWTTGNNGIPSGWSVGNA